MKSKVICEKCPFYKEITRLKNGQYSHNLKQAWDAIIWDSDLGWYTKVSDSGFVKCVYDCNYELEHLMSEANNAP